MLKPNRTKPCKLCGKLGHYPSQCFEEKTPKSKTKLKQAGKYTRQWLLTRKSWFKKNPPNWAGYYICYICDKWLRPNNTTLDHVKSRSRHPELRFTLSNLRPCCYDCNAEKGSKDYE